MSASAATRPAGQSSPASGMPAVILGLAWLSAFSARSSTISVGPVLPLMQRDLHLSYAQAGFLFSLPVLMMGLFAIPSGLIIARLGSRWVLLISLSMVAVGGGLRALSGNAPVLFICTAITGAGIGLLQPVLPRLVKDWCSERTGMITGIYSSGFPVGAVLAASLAVPVLLPLSGALSWRGPFLLWSAVVWLTVVGWLLVRRPGSRQRESLEAFRGIFKNRLCWLVSGLFLSQSMIYYVLNSWLTSYYQGFGWSLGAAASTLAFLSGGSVIGGFSGPAGSDRIGRRKLLLIAAAGALIGLLGLLLAPTHIYWFWSLLLGACTAALFTTCLLIPVDVATAGEVGAFSGLMMAVGYAGVIVGPPLVGLLRDLTGRDVFGLIALLGVGLVELWLVLRMPETDPRRRASTGLTI